MVERTGQEGPNTGDDPGRAPAHHSNLWVGVVFLVIGITIGGIIGGIYSQQRQEAPGEGVIVTVVLDFGNGVVVSYPDVTLEDNTPLSALYLACDAGHANQTVRTTYYALYDATMVDSVGDHTNGDGGRYWQYYVNGEMPMESADKMALDNGDTVRWSFEVSTWT